jgi:acyl carrier protein
VHNDFETIPIGRPIHNTRLYVIKDGAQVAIGEPGELCIAGVGLARGYLNNASLTDEKFTDNPANPGERIYRTGDIARWLPDGSLDLRGRLDFQTKIRGFRVELPEIERALASLPHIREAAVVVRESPAGKQLHAYYVAESAVNVAEVRNALAKHLPGYMIPTHFQALDRMPLTINAKIDRQALPVIAAPVSNAPMAEPRSALERQVAAIVRQILGNGQIGLHDNFFEAGADSLSMITINNHLKKALSREVPLAALFEHTSIAGLAAYLGENAADEERKNQEEAGETEAARGSLLKTRTLIYATDEA